MFIGVFGAVKYKTVIIAYSFRLNWTFLSLSLAKQSKV